MPKTLSNVELIGFLSVVGVGLLFRTMKQRSNLPSEAEQLWLNEQLATPRSNLTPEEQKWLDKQIQEASDAEMLDDARQAGNTMHHPRLRSRRARRAVLKASCTLTCDPCA